MLARLRKSQDSDQGFTLIELLVVMIIIGILAAIAIPVFLSQRAKAQDSATKADVSTIGKEIATYFVDASATGAALVLSVTGAPGAERYGFTGPVTQDVGKVSNNVTIQSRFIASPTSWCVSLRNQAGSKPDWKYSAAGGLSDGACTNADG